jgi:hypothetical protein
MLELHVVGEPAVVLERLGVEAGGRSVELLERLLLE